MTPRTAPAPSGPGTERRSWAAGLLRLVAGPRTLREGVYLLLNFPLATALFVFAVTGVAVSGGLLIVFVGLPLLCLVLLSLHGYGYVERARARVLLRLNVADPAPLYRDPASRGAFSWMGTVLRSGQCWRSLVYAFVFLPWAMVTFLGTLMIWALGLGGLTYPLWFWSLAEHDRPGVNVDGQGGGWVWDGPLELVLVPVTALLVLTVGAYVVRAMAGVDRLLVAALLGPSSAESRVRELETGRSVVVDTSAADLRRIERDLHDGAQARLVSLAMELGLAKEKLAEDPEKAARMVDEAHGEVKLALQELRQLARGIHPAILTDRGLGPALSAVASRCTVPVTVQVDLVERPVSAIEGIAYYTASELLQNVSKHSRATSATLDAWRTDGQLLLQVTDDGVGGASTAGGSGLSGLADRLAAVDGVLAVNSPLGGPTTITAGLPWWPRDGA